MSVRTSLLRGFAFGAALVLAGAASAEPIGVEYFVLQKPFKKAVRGTDVLDFRLYSDADCTIEIGSYPLFANDEYAHYYVDKRQRLAGGAKHGKAIRIHAMIDAPTTTSAPYLMVHGVGIVPIGEACQLQAGSPVAALGPQGEQGPAGPQGPQGEAGPQGPAGPQGEAGPQGLPGEPGPQGPEGAQGAVGPQGPQGEVGPQGPAGPQGEVGPQGPAGEAGPQGPQGEVGPQGPAGPQGEAGPQGAQGEVGPVGPQGPAGQDGTAGSLLGGNYSNTADGNFLSPFNPSAGSEENTNLPVTSGHAHKLIVNVGDALGGGASVTLTVRKNGVDTGLSCTVGAGEHQCVNYADSVDFADGDLMSVRYNESGNPNSRVRFTVVYQAP